MSHNSPPPKKPRLNQSTLLINNLNPDYLVQLKEKIPILKNKLLLQLILNYGAELAQNDPNIDTTLFRINKLIYILSTLTEIPENLTNAEEITKPTNSNFKSDTYLNETNKKYVKTHSLNAKGLIEAIIQFTLYYYDPTICPQLISMNINNVPLSLENQYTNIRKRFKQKMNFYKPDEYISLGKYLYLLFEGKIYKENESNIINNDELQFSTILLESFRNLTPEQKLEKLKVILIKIANKVKKMQQYGFIHGDFHTGNIYLELDVNIYFIDFGFSCIKLPLRSFTRSIPVNNNSITSFFLCVPVPEYLRLENVQLRYPYYDTWKNIDLFHLIEEMHTLKIQNILFKNIIMTIRKNYLANIPKISGSIHSYTCSRNFNTITDFFYPANFIIIIHSLRINPRNSNNVNISLPTNESTILPNQSPSIHSPSSLLFPANVSLSSVSPNANGFGSVSKRLF